ncbi:MAG: hypothetical protein HY290_29880 [Planctomycetia bacterium]|nr:hypothetical protein [Planctomycetia bacterium]
MAFKAGVWIDHTKAVVVLISGTGHKTRQFESGVTRPFRSAGGSRAKTPYTPHDYVAEDSVERKLMARLKNFYDEVIACLRDAEAILIVGPGEAKGEFKKRIKTKKLRGRLAELETADKMSDRQIAAKVRQHFESEPEKKDETGRSRKRLKKTS